MLAYFESLSDTSFTQHFERFTVFLINRTFSDLRNFNRKATVRHSGIKQYKNILTQN